ncbi:MAG: mandelate racemase/muconate lactonizing enzyme family protein [Dysgonamonadaceae bacterium]|nr:mandelate racemase/muconate lactonizing enzyme family protein [Dysgonamonadaceae bacterium]
MDRRFFLQSLTAGSASAFIPAVVSADSSFLFNSQSDNEELAYHKLQGIDFTDVQLKYPRLVGKNSRLGVHGTGPRVTFCTLITDKGAKGLGLLRGNREKAKEIFETIKGKKVSELFSPSEGTLDENCYAFDFCLHDLGGVILNKPVYELISGNKKPILTACYSGMIYFDEMEPENNPSGLGKVLENCRFDYNYGYRQLKVKIGRGGKWMSKEEGLKTDIEVTKMIYENFPDCDILVDGNDAFTVDYFISYLKGIENIPLYWIEEPFRETRTDYVRLKEWLVNNGRRNTFLADGEAQPDLQLALELGKEKYLDIYLDDISGYGFTRWRRLNPRLKAIGMMASPHAWGDTIKSFYIVHFAGAFGNVPTIEGVTCFSDDIDLSGYKLHRGQLIPPATPGFGLKLYK